MENERFKSTTAIFVAFVTVLGAIAACLATNAMSTAANADFEGMNAAIRAQKAEIVNQITAFGHYRAFTEYTRYMEYGNLLYDPNADEATGIKNGVLQRAAWGIAWELSSSNFFEPRYVTQDGIYNLQRELDEALSQDSQIEDLNSAPYFKKSDQMRRRSYAFTFDMIVLAVSFWFLQLGQVTEHKIKYVWVIIGSLLGLGGILGMLIGSTL